MGAPPVEWWLDDYFKWLGHPYYLALQSAAAKFGSTPQALQVNQVMTDVPRREITVGRTRICFFVKCGIAHTPTESLPDAYAPLLISTPEATAFDLVRYAPRIGGIGRAAETLVPLLPLLRVAEMKRVLNTGNEVSTAQRLGYLLEKMGKEKVAEAIHDWVPARASLVPLIPAMGSRKTEAPIIARWRIVNNLGGVSL